nr:MAG TPA: hypothetical protein [Caudoviricetes sp.]
MTLSNLPHTIIVLDRRPDSSIILPSPRAVK